MKDLHGPAYRQAIKNTLSTHHHKLLLLGGLLSVAAIAPATAVAAANTDDHTLTTVKVQSDGAFKATPVTNKGYAKSITRVASKSPATLRQIPQSVSMVTQQTIEDRNYTTLDELAYGTPGLRVLDSGRGRSSIYARGFEYSDYNINGLPAPMSSILGTVPNLAAFDHVEILRGPSGLFNATSEMGGIINMVLKKPTKQFQGHVTGQYGSYNHHYEQLDVSGPLAAEGRVRGRFVIADDGSDTVKDLDGNHSQTYYGTSAIDLTDTTTLNLAVLRQERKLVPDNGVPTGPGGELLDFSDDTFVGADWNNFDADSTDLVAELRHDFSDGSQARGGVRYSDRDANFNYVFGGSALAANNTLTLSGLGGEVSQHTWSADSSYYHPFDFLGENASFVIGADFKHYRTNEVMSRAKGLGPYHIDDVRDIAYIDVGSINPQGTYTTLKDYGVYGKVTIHPIADLALIAGSRISRYDIEQNNNTRKESGLVTPYAGIVYDLSAHHTLYASYSRVFKPQTGTDAAGNILKPREGNQYEIGLKSSYYTGRLHTRLTAFTLKDKNAGVPAAPHSPVQKALGERRVRGIEAEVSGGVTDNLDIILGYTYLSTRVDTGSSKQQGIFMLMPKNRANLWGVYHFHADRLAGLKIGGGVSAVSDFEAIQGIHAPGYMVVNAMVGYQFTPKLSTKLNINNLLNKEYYRRVGSFGTFNQRGEPVNVMASLRYDF